MNRFETPFAVLLFAEAAMAYNIQALPSTSICYEGLNKTTDKTILLKYRDRILLSLAADVSIAGFAAASAGQPPHQQYGLAMCLGSSSQEACRSCISFSRLRLDDFDCESSTFLGESCFLRLSSVNVTGVMDNQMLVVVAISSGGNASDNAALYDQMLKNFLNNLTFVNQRAEPAEEEIGFNSTSKIHGHVQCTRDIAMANCSSCLAKLTESFIQENLAARGTREIFCSESCVIRYELESLAAIPPPALPPPIPGTNQTSSNPSRSDRNLLINGYNVVIALITLHLRLRFFEKWLKQKKMVGNGQSRNLNSINIASDEAWYELVLSSL